MVQVQADIFGVSVAISGNSAIVGAYQKMMQVALLQVKHISLM